jgi:(R)-2-hydroxyacyl-CoA dehydratese activating ATPase
VSPKPEALYCGVDVGASATKLVIVDEHGEMRGKAVRVSGVDYLGTATLCREEALAELDAGVEDIVATVATGYGRHNITFADGARTEIHCHGVGCYHHAPRAISIIDIGGQDNKVIRLEPDGRRANFKMNRKCAAGTGAFIEEIAMRLGIQLEEMDPLARSAEEAVHLSSFCTVFAKTEILSHLRQGAPVAGIIRGAFVSVVARVVEMDSLTGDIMATGGVVAHNPAIVEILSEKLGRTVEVPPHPQFTGALGAALSARSLD